MAIAPHNFYSINFMHDNSFIQRMNDILSNELIRKMKEIRGQSEHYNVNIRFEREYNALRPHFFYIIQIRKEEKYDNIKNILNSFVFTLKSKNPHDNDCTLQELLQEFHDLLDGFVEKLILAEELFDRYNLHINEDMEGVEIDVRKNNNRIEYKLTKTPLYNHITNDIDMAEYNHVTAENQKDGLVSLIVDNWMTLDEIKTAIDLVYE